MVEGARLLSEYTVKSCIVGSNPILSANAHSITFHCVPQNQGYPRQRASRPSLTFRGVPIPYAAAKLG